MKKRITAFIIAGLAVGCLFAHNLDNYSRMRLVGAEHSLKARAADSSTAEVTYYPMIIEINDECAIDMLNAVDAVIYHRRANFVLADVPTDAVSLLDKSKFIDYATIAKTTSATCDMARSFANIDAVHNGTDGIAGYDGTGVIAGICDRGFDPAHIVFDGKIGMMSTYDEPSAKRTVYAPGAAIQTDEAFPDCDTDDETHGTHTANILAGGRENNKYYGAAPGAQLAMSASCLSEMGLLCGIEDIIAYAKEQNKPAVINLSVGSYMGPHDGTDIVNRYLDLLGKEAIICFSAGNNGRSAYCLQYDFTADNNQVGSMFDNFHKWSGFDISGYADLWSSDSRSFELQFVAYDRVEGQYIYESDWVAGDDEGSYTVLFADNEALAPHFDAGNYMAAAWELNKFNNRFNLMMVYNINPNEKYSESSSSARYVCGWRVRGKDGAHLDGYADGVYSFFHGWSVEGMTTGNNAGSISNLCCNHSTVSVGSCNSRSYVPLSGGAAKDYSGTSSVGAVGDVSSWSSYGTLIDGRKLPHICAPGCIVVSAMSGKYYEKNPDGGDDVCCIVTVGDKKHYWTGMSGTSMASPLTAGIIALWMQAEPELTAEQAIEVAQATAQTDFSDITNVRWGAGCIDAFAGLKKILNSGVANVSNGEVAFRIEGRRIVSTAPVTIYDTMGRRYAQDRELTPGIYIVSTPVSTKKVSIF